MVDTIHTVIQTVAKTTDNSMELISQVNAFYDSAWNKLIVVNSVILAVVGILVPLVIQWYQKKSLKISEELLRKDLQVQALQNEPPRRKRTRYLSGILFSFAASGGEFTQRD